MLINIMIHGFRLLIMEYPHGIILVQMYQFQNPHLANSIEAARYNDTWYGLTSQTYNSSTGYTTKFTIKVNARTISEDATNFNNFAKSTVTHEFGHVFWLCDNPNTSKSSIMKYSRNRNSMTAPQTFDVDNVNAKYD